MATAEWLRKLDRLDQLELASKKQAGGSAYEDMTGYGSNWPKTLKERGLPKAPGKDPVEVFKQGELFGDQTQVFTEPGTGREVTPSGPPDRIPAVDPTGKRLYHPDGRPAYTDEIGPDTPKLSTEQLVSSVDYGEPTELDKYFKEHGYPNRNMSDEERLKIMRGAPKKT